MCPRGGLEHGFRCDFPGSGKSCNKSNTSGPSVPGYSAACSLFGPLPGLCMEEAAGVVDVLLHRWLPCGYPAAGLGRQVLATFCDEHGDTRAQVSDVLALAGPSLHCLPSRAERDDLERWPRSSRWYRWVQAITPSAPQALPSALGWPPELTVLGILASAAFPER